MKTSSNLLTNNLSSATEILVEIYRFGSEIDHQESDSPEMESASARLIGIATSELKFVTDLPFRFSEEIGVGFPSTDDANSVFPATVNMIQKQGRNKWHVTCSFHDSIRRPVVQQLANQGVIDRRQQSRNPSDVSASIRWECCRDEIEAEVRNISQDGCRLAITDANPDALRLLISIQHQDRENLEIKAVKKWLTRSKSLIEIGCEFDRPLSRDWVARISQAINDANDPGLGLVNRMLCWLKPEWGNSNSAT